MGPQESKVIATRKDPAFRVRLPKPLLKAITQRARKNGRSRNSEIVVVITRALIGDETPERR